MEAIHQNPVGLSQEDYFVESQRLYSRLLSQPSRGEFWVFLGLAFLIHATAFSFYFEIEQPVYVEPDPGPVAVWDYPLPPPPPMDPPSKPKKPERAVLAIPVPDPDPEEPEPVIDVIIEDPVFSVPTMDFPPQLVATLGSGDVIPAKQLNVVVPEFPALAKNAGIREAKVQVLLTVGIDGKVKDVTWLDGLKIYRPPVVEAMYQWTFEPATLDGQPVEYTWSQSFVFRLE